MIEAGAQNGFSQNRGIAPSSQWGLWAGLALGRSLLRSLPQPFLSKAAVAFMAGDLLKLLQYWGVCGLQV